MFRHQILKGFMFATWRKPYQREYQFRRSVFNNKVPYNLFNKWYTDTRHRVVPVSGTGGPRKE